MKLDRRDFVAMVPIAVFAVIVAVAIVPLARGTNPKIVRSVLIDKPVPAFTRTEFSSAALKGHISLVNFFASWCPPCEAENDTLLMLKQKYGLRIYGVDYKDSASGRQDFLRRLGNPYVAVTPDPHGDLAILWGTYGVPETFVIDARGRIRYRHAAPLTPRDVQETLLPLLREIRQ